MVRETGRQRRAMESDDGSQREKKTETRMDGLERGRFSLSALSSRGRCSSSFFLRGLSAPRISSPERKTES